LSVWLCNAVAMQEYFWSVNNHELAIAITRSTQQTTKNLLFGSWGIDEGSNKTRQDKRRLPQIPVLLLRNGVQGSNKRDGSNSLLRSYRRSGRESNGDDEGEMGDTQKDPKHRNRRADGQLLTQWKFPNLGLQFMFRVMNPIKGLPGFEDLVKAWIRPSRGR
jgi:hypothetical protein